jgi:hypothetical protein
MGFFLISTLALFSILAVVGIGSKTVSGVEQYHLLYKLRFVIIAPSKS